MKRADTRYAVASPCEKDNPALGFVNDKFWKNNSMAKMAEAASQAASVAPSTHG